LGAATGLAATAHATGHLLPFATGAVLLALRAELRRPATLARWCAAGGAAHAAMRIAGGLLLGGGDLRQTLGYTADQLGRFSPAWLAPVAWHEWLLPFAPLSAAALLAFAVRPQ